MLKVEANPLVAALMAEVVAYAVSKFTAAEHAAALTPEDVATLAAMCSQFGLTVSWQTAESAQGCFTGNEGGTQ